MKKMKLALAFVLCAALMLGCGTATFSATGLKTQQTLSFDR